MHTPSELRPTYRALVGRRSRDLQYARSFQPAPAPRAQAASTASAAGRPAAPSAVVSRRVQTMAVQSQEELDKLFDQLDSEDKKKRAVPHIPHLITKLHGYQEQVLSHAHTRRSCVRPIRTDVYAVVTLRCHAQPPPGGVRGWHFLANEPNRARC